MNVGDILSWADDDEKKDEEKSEPGPPDYPDPNRPDIRVPPVQS